jgi:hypothetical protein
MLTATVSAAIIGVIVAVAFGAIVALPVMWLWNGCIAGFFPIGEIGYLHAWGLLILCNLLFSKTHQTNKSK